jgi:recombinational DNA repair protein (RecF pathway)
MCTEAFGVLRARATGIRKEDSKLRYSLQVGAQAAVSLVQGKAGWRVTGAVLRVAPTQGTITLFARLAKLTERLVHGSEPNDELFKLFTQCRHAQDIPSSEIMCVAQMLSSLGYIAPERINSLLQQPVADQPEYVAQHRPQLLELINSALTASHL